MRRTVLVAALALAGCAAPPPPAPAPEPAPAPVAAPPAPETPASAALKAHYAAVQAALLSEGLLRTEMAPYDAPFTDRNLMENFLTIALHEEYSGGQISTRRSGAAIPLQRWAAPIRVAVIFGPAVPAEQVATDRARVASYFARLARVSGHPITLTDKNPNFWVHVATVDERAALEPVLSAEMPGLTAGQIDSVTHMNDTTYCQVLTQTDEATSTYARAVAVIPSEHPDLMRLACFHEELAQALGLPNDSNAARPSIFNDDQEFALLTKQDELMLRILYDPALRPGMTEAEARPIVQSLASRLLGGNS
jgi:hypothetical protein